MPSQTEELNVPCDLNVCLFVFTPIIDGFVPKNMEINFRTPNFEESDEPRQRCHSVEFKGFVPPKLEGVP